MDTIKELQKKNKLLSNFIQDQYNNLCDNCNKPCKEADCELREEYQKVLKKI